MNSATERQTKLFESIVNEFIETSEPVGSKYLVKKYNLDVSPATVRNDMASLVNLGFLAMDHGSSGRFPTTLGLRVYLNELMEEQEIPIVQEVAMKQRIWEARFSPEKLLHEASHALSELTELLAIVTTSDGHLFNSGAHYLLDQPEFLDIDVTRTILHLSDNHNLITEILNKGKDDLNILIGDELGLDNLSPCSVICASFKKDKHKGYIAIIGPSRMHYNRNIPAIRSIKKLIEETN
ncbi:MAG: hypothetical protein O2871_00840 [bacterium]|nr:hypothetical protein [bacterium]